MAYNKLVNYKRNCKLCKSNKTAVTKKSDGVKRPNWYIDYTSSEGGWICSNCYYSLKSGHQVTMISEFVVCSNSSIEEGWK